MSNLDILFITEMLFPVLLLLTSDLLISSNISYKGTVFGFPEANLKIHTNQLQNPADRLFILSEYEAREQLLSLNQLLWLLSEVTLPGQFTIN